MVNATENRRKNIFGYLRIGKFFSYKFKNIFSREVYIGNSITEEFWYLRSNNTDRSMNLQRYF
jgi:hypothetical protein